MSWRCEKNTRCPLSLVAILKKSLLVLFNATAESVNYSVFWKKLQKRFSNLTFKKNFVKHIKNLPQHLSEKFIGDNLLSTDIALKKLRFIGIALDFFEVIDYRYRCSTKRFIVPITGDDFGSCSLISPDSKAGADPHNDNRSSSSKTFVTANSGSVSCFINVPLYPQTDCPPQTEILGPLLLHGYFWIAQINEQLAYAAPGKNAISIEPTRLDQ